MAVVKLAVDSLCFRNASETEPGGWCYILGAPESRSPRQAGGGCGQRRREAPVSLGGSEAALARGEPIYAIMRRTLAPCRALRWVEHPSPMQHSGTTLARLFA